MTRVSTPSIVFLNKYDESSGMFFECAACKRVGQWHQGKSADGPHPLIPVEGLAAHGLTWKCFILQRTPHTDKRLSS